MLVIPFWAVLALASPSVLALGLRGGADQRVPTKSAIAPSAGLTSYAVTPASAVAKPKSANTTLRGVNLSAGEMGRAMPSTLDRSYTYPTDAEIDYYADQGFSVVRIPFRWERLQFDLNGPLTAVDRARLRASVTHARKRGLTVVLDMHNYARRLLAPAFNTHAVVGAYPLPSEALADAWLKIAADYRGDAKVWLGLMNEPHDMTLDSWWSTAQLVVNRLRAGSINNTVLVSGTYWDSSQRWVPYGNAARAELLTDPANKLIFEVHQYLDTDGSGTSGACKPGSVGRVNKVIAWAQAKKKRLFFGEIAASGDKQCQIEYPAMLKVLENSGVVAGWTAWGGGSWWSTSYPFRLTPVGWPKANTPPPHLALLKKYMAQNP